MSGARASFTRATLSPPLARDAGALGRHDQAIPAERDIRADIATQRRSRDGIAPRERERAIAELAGRQHGVVAHRQLLALGLGAGAIEHRVDRGRLHRAHRGVYAVGQARLTSHGAWQAAVLAYPDAVLSHCSAAALWGLLPSRGSLIHVCVQGQHLRGRAGVVLHRTRSLPGGDRVLRAGIRATSLPRTLLDLAAVADLATLRRAVEEADRLQILDLSLLSARNGALRGRRGTRTLATVLGDLCQPDASRSELERRFAQLCRRAGLPEPSMNVLAAGFQVDALWPGRRLIVELDGYAFHRSRAAFERDRARDAALALAGFRVVRLTFRRIQDEPEAVAALLRRLLGARAGSG